MNLEDLKAAFADDEDILTFEDEGNYFTVKMEYQPGSLGKAKWDAINNQIKEFGGEWVSAGRMSHWKVPKKQPENPELEADTDVKVAFIREATEMLRARVQMLERHNKEINNLLKRIKEAGL